MPDFVTAIAAAAPAIGMIAVFLLGIFGTRQIVRGENRQKGVLMLVLAAVILGNILIMTI